MGLFCFSAASQDKPAKTATLRNVVVTGKKKLIEQKLDRIIVNVDAMITAAGDNTLEVLTKSPGVSVDINGNISLNGKRNVLVLIDGRPTYMQAQNLADYLRSLPAGILDKIELMSNPPAKYDASGGAVINIILKKNQAKGFNGNVSAGCNQGVYARINNALNINYRAKKFNLFGNFSYSNAHNFNDNNDSRYFYNTDESLHSALLMNSRYTSLTKAWNARTGMDYFVSRKTTLGVMLNANIRPKTDRLDYTGNGYNNSMQLDSISTGYTNGDYRWKNYSINLNLQHKFDSAGKTLTADIDHINYQSGGSQFSANAVYLPGNIVAGSDGLLFATPSNVHIWSVKTDYTQAIKGNIQFDAGFKHSYVSNDNQLNWFNQSSGNTFIPDYGKTDHFIYSEHVTAAYLTLVKEWKRWAAEAGLRMENTQARGHQLGNPAVPDSVFNLRYTSLFPVFYTSYKLDSAGSNTLTLSYGNRIRRPGYQQLNPFLFYHDRYTYSSGNPGLSPEYNYSLDLRYNYKQYVSATLSYSWERSLVYPTTRAAGDLFITRPQNYSSRRSIGIIPYVFLSPAKWWSLHANALVIFFINYSDGDGVQLTKYTNMHEVEVFNQFYFNKSWSVELNGFFPGRQSFGQTQAGSTPSYNISAGIQKTILKKQGTIRLKMDDIFHTMRRNSQTIGINQVSSFHEGQTDTRLLGLSFSYRFGREANARKRNHNTGGAGDEEKRVN